MSVDDLLVSAVLLQNVLYDLASTGVVSQEDFHPIQEHVATISAPRSLLGWNTLINIVYSDNEDRRVFANLAAAIAQIQAYNRSSRVPSRETLEATWNAIRDALAQGTFKVNPDPRGFMSIPLCALQGQKSIIEQYSLHVWMPTERALSSGYDSDSEIYSCLEESMNCVLAGEAGVHLYDVHTGVVPGKAQYCECSKAYMAYSSHSTFLRIPDLHRILSVHPTSYKVHTCDSSFTVKSRIFHRIDTVPNALLATFSCSGKPEKSPEEKCTLMPKQGSMPIRLDILENLSARELGKLIESVRKWTCLMNDFDKHANLGEWEYALKSLNHASYVCETALNGQNMARYRYLVADGLGFVNRCLGRFETAQAVLESALQDMGLCRERIGICAELGIVYRHSGRLEDAKQVFEDQFNTARQLELQEASCRAVGSLGMVNYQLSLQQDRKELLDAAIAQLEERVQRAAELKYNIERGTCEPTNSGTQYADTLKAVGLARLSLCYSARGDADKAVSSALESLEITNKVQDPTVVAMSRFFYGRALVRQNRLDEAMAQFNMNNGCSCAIALSKEPSTENRQFLQELADVGTNFHFVDRQGYTALDHATFNEDAAAKEIILAALRRGQEAESLAEVQQVSIDAELRKGYRDIFQDRMRPILLRRQDSRLRKIRWAYANALDVDAGKERLFDRLKYVPYKYFATMGRFSRSSDRLTKQYTTDTKSTDVDFIIFFSYRWLNSNPWATSPDDAENTQYLRTIKAVEDFLEVHSDVDIDTLGIWIDYACIDQINPTSGIAALPMIIAQCNALISLVDADYYDRAWCSVEVMVITELRRAYGLHDWFEHVRDTSGDGAYDGHWLLREGSLDSNIDLDRKQLRFEEDRSKIQFLARQCRILC